MSLDTSPRPAELTAGTGTVHLPGEPGFDAARMPWNVAVDQRPAAVAAPRTAADVIDVVRSARRAGLRIAAQGTGHNAGPLAAQGLDDVLLLRTGALDEISIDPDRRIARVGSGVIWAPVVEAAGAHGLAALHGSSPDVGVAGYSVGGGLGWYARQFGLQSGSVTAIELVTAEGKLLRADATEHADLFWALRGGGGAFGVVTALEFGLHPIETTFAGMLIWDVTHADAVLRTWVPWAAAAPDEVTTAFRVLNLPPLPEIPEPLRGRSLAVVDGAVLAADAQAEQLIAPLRALSPEIDTFGRVPATALARLHMDPEGPTPAVADTALLGPVASDGIDRFLEQVGPGSGSSLLMSELRQLGGALRRPDPNGGALDHLDGDLLLFAVAVAPTPEHAEAGLRDVRALAAAMRPEWTGGHYLNFAEVEVEPTAAFGAQTQTRLAHVRATYDPDRAMVSNHPVD